MIALSVKLKPSTDLTTILCIAHFVTIAVWWQLTLPTDFKLIGSAILLASLMLYCRHHALLASAKSIVALELNDAMECTLETRDGRHITCKILGSTFVAPYLVVLNLKPLNDASARSVIILADAIDAGVFRQLRILLRWKWQAESKNS